LGNAAAYFPFIASLGFRVIALHHPDHQEYLKWMQKRDRREGQADQGDHWKWHRDQFDYYCNSNPNNILMFDTISDFPSDIIVAIRRIADHFGLELYRNLPGEPQD
jgi:hypothetical protein